MYLRCHFLSYIFIPFLSLISSTKYYILWHTKSSSTKICLQNINKIIAPKITPPKKKLFVQFSNTLHYTHKSVIHCKQQPFQTTLLLIHYINYTNYTQPRGNIQKQHHFHSPILDFLHSLLLVFSLFFIINYVLWIEMKIIINHTIFMMSHLYVYIQENKKLQIK